jgi:adenine-specific DNA-methyltransferase
VYYTPDATTQAQLATLASNIKLDRSAEDLLFQVMLDWGVDLAAPIRSTTLAGKTVWAVTEPSGASLLACFDDAGGINDALVRALAEQHPDKVVFRDAGFANDSVKINVEQLFKALSPTTEIRVL